MTLCGTIKWNRILLLSATVVSLTYSRQQSTQKPAELPSYKLTVGQVLNYESSSNFAGKDYSYQITDKCEIWVLGRNADGSWRLLSRNENTYKSANPPTDQKGIELTYVTLFPDGRIETNQIPYSHNVVLLRTCFIMLPSDPTLLRTTWQRPNRQTNETYIYTLSPESNPDQGRWIFQKATNSLSDDIYGLNKKSKIHFDANKGLVEKIENSYSQSYGLVGTTEQTINLTGITVADADFIGQLSKDAEAYFSAQDTYESMIDALGEHPDSPDEQVSKARNILVSAQKKVSHPLFADRLKEMLTRHDKSAEFLKQRAATQNPFLNKPSPDWQTTDFQGKTYSMQALRGKVVVLDFWYRGCIWCIRSMPQIKELADSFAGQNVVILGMNVDEDPNNAKFVIEKMKLTYPNLKAQDIAEKYSVRGYPTMLIIDTNGIVKDFNIGYQPSLRDVIITKIKPLLPPIPDKTTPK
jgi:thiol-disulfide isomerase/thioredoxin